MTGFPDLDRADRDLLDAATEAARAGARVHRSRRPDAGGAGWDEKGRSDFVTEVDREAERRIVRRLRDRFPDHVVVAEEGTQDEAPADGAGGAEGGAGPDDAAVHWIVDPLDGTTNWLHGYREHAVSVACADAEGLRVGVVLDSAAGELYQAVRGAGSRRDGERIEVSPVDDLRLALVGTGFPFKKEELVRPYLATLERVLTATSGVRRGGSAALDLCALAGGRLDAFWELWLMPWDVAAGALIVREAGGVFRPLEFPGVTAGEPPVPSAPELRSGGYVAGNPRLVHALEELVLDAG